MKFVHLAVLCSAFLVSGCATTPQAPIEDTAFYLARLDTLWEVILATLEEESIMVRSMEKEKGIIITKFHNYMVGPSAHHAIDEIAYRPSVHKAIFSQVGYSFTISITQVTEMSSKVRVMATIEAYDSNMTKAWHACPSKSILEYQLLDKIRTRL
ncbi:MAG: hypothetical protein ACP5G0_12105 [Desulfomonilia bacterium]